MENYYATIKLKISGNNLDFEEVLSIGETITTEINSSKHYPHLNEAILISIGKDNPIFLDINPVLKEE